MLVLILGLNDSSTEAAKTAVSKRATSGAIGRVYSNPAQTPAVETMSAVAGATMNMLFTLKQNWSAIEAGVTSSTNNQQATHDVET